MPIFEILKRETSTESIYVEAETPEQAEAIVQDPDFPSEAWRQCQDYESEIISIEPANVDEVDQHYVHTDERGEEFIFHKD